MSAQPYVCVIGAANVDLVGCSHGIAVAEESNPGSLHISWGGVARNVAENLARLEVPVKLITVLGDDVFGNRIAQHASQCGIDLHAHIIAGGTTPAYLCINDGNGELVVAVAAMGLMDQLGAALIRENSDIIRGATLCVLDANLDQSLIDYLLETYPELDFFVDAVSIAKSERLKPWLGKFRGIKLNRAEAGHLSGINISSGESLRAAADFFLNQGAEQVFISLGTEGLFYSDANISGSLKIEPGINSISTTGAGDALLAGMVAATYGGLDLEQAASQAMAAAAVTLEHQGAVNPNMSRNVLAEMSERIQHA